MMDKTKEVYFTYKDFSGNLIINPKSTIQDQVFELVNNFYLEKNEPPLKRYAFEEGKIIIKE